ncbi:glycosyltransferase family protein [Shimia sp. W99]
MNRVAEDGCFLAEGMHYLSFFKSLHNSLKPEWYLEIGTQTGVSLELSSAKSISVDPVFRLRTEVMGNKPALYAFQETSDDFFANGHIEKLGAKIDLAFLDGMHLFEYLLRDFIGTERHCTSKGVVVLHDCLPWTAGMASRSRSDAATSSWTGDVWKMVPVLRKYRPDLTLEIVDAEPTGLVIIANLDPKNRILEKNYDKIMEEFLDVSLAEYGVEKYFSSFSVVPALSSRFMSEYPFDLVEEWENNPDVCIKIPAPNKSRMTFWGDYAFARGIARTFSRKGHRTYIASQEDWDLHAEPGGIDIVLRGRAQVPAIPGRTTLFWCISKGMRDINYNEADHVFWASQTLMEEGESGRGKGISTLLPQAFDAELMTPPKSRKSREGIVFVGRSRAKYVRKSVLFADQAGLDFKIWGPGWRKSEYKDYVQDDFIDNSELPAIYQSASIVLNDHTPVMQVRGLLSNRVFDTLACGAIPVSEDVGWLPEDLSDYIYTYTDFDSFKAAIESAQNEPASKLKKREALARKLSEMHSFDARVETILSVVESLGSKQEIAAE